MNVLGTKVKKENLMSFYMLLGSNVSLTKFIIKLNYSRKCFLRHKIIAKVEILNQKYHFIYLYFYCFGKNVFREL